jgi:hypothetical protein
MRNELMQKGNNSWFKELGNWETESMALGNLESWETGVGYELMLLRRYRKVILALTNVECWKTGIG